MKSISGDFASKFLQGKKGAVEIKVAPAVKDVYLHHEYVLVRCKYFNSIYARVHSFELFSRRILVLSNPHTFRYFSVVLFADVANSWGCFQNAPL